MLNDINMEFIQAFNPLYAVPIVAVILCAFIVYAFGFKSPVPPPSFEGIEEEKKYSKKRKAKDNQKKEKLVQNGKANGSSATKNSAPTKKKETTEKRTVEKEKPNATEKKSPSVEKKGNKKAKLPTEKKSTQEKKKESISPDDFNEDGWVQLVSKKGRKNQKKNDAATTETQTQSVPSVLSKTNDATKSDDNSKVGESAKKKEETPKDTTKTDEKQQSSATKKENAATKTPTANIEKVKVQNVVVEEPKPEVTNIEKPHPKETTANSPKVLEESNKPKKKKKKITEVITAEKDSINKPKSVSDSSAAQVISDIPAPQEITKPVIVEDLPPANKVVEKDQPLEVKPSNVAFDELAGLYPEAKEPKKKKKVRRDH